MEFSPALNGEVNQRKPPHSHKLLATFSGYIVGRCWYEWVGITLCRRVAARYGGN